MGKVGKVASGRAKAAEGAVREGEAFDVAAVDTWLHQHIPDLSGTPHITQFHGGASNWTYRLQYPAHDLILRRAPAGTRSRGSHDMEREFRIQQALKPHVPEVPSVVGHCADTGLIGSEFYVMQRIDGVIPRARLPEAWAHDKAIVGRMCDTFIGRWAALHKVDVEGAGLGWLHRGPGYAKRQVAGWSERYTKARTWNVPTFARVQAWLRERAPEDAATCVIHNDWRFDNLVFAHDDPGHIIGILDWELATVGDPLMDLGSALAYWVHADDAWPMRVTRRQPTHLPGMLRREEVVARWSEKTGIRVQDWAFYEVFGLFRLAGIAQQIYYRFHHKQTRNPAFRNFWIFINYFDWRCRGIMRRAPS